MQTRETTTETPGGGRPAAVELAAAFVRAVEQGADAAALLSPDAVEEEMPNRIFAQGMTRDPEAMRVGLARGRQIFRAQRYAIARAMGDEAQAALEVEWTGELGVALPSRDGALPEGTVLRARVAFFFDVHQGRIVRIRHYDCFDPF